MMFGPNRNRVIRIIAIVVAAVFIFGIVAAIVTVILPFVIALGVIGAIIYFLRRGKRKQ